MTEPAGGLTGAQARALLAEVGPNVLVHPAPPRHLRAFLAKLVHLFALLLWAGAALAWIAGEPELSAAIAVVVLVNAVFSFAQEYRAERATEALRRMLPQEAVVVRDGAETVVSAEELVPGDLLVLRAGDRVSADADVVEESELRLDLSALTGEARAVRSQGHVRAGTYVARGTARAVVRATGMATEFGRIAALTQSTREGRSPLEHELDRLTRLVAVLSLAIGTAFFLLAGFAGMDTEDRLVFAIAITVANVPEGLLPTVTLALALGTQRMAGRNALVRRLSSVETLGATTVICTDKTGTLTENEMTVQRVWTAGGEYTVEGAGYEPFGRFRRNGTVADPGPLEELLRCALLCNDARLVSREGGWTVRGDPTEGALVVLAEKGGLRHEQETARAPRVHELAFDSTRKRMSTVHLAGGERIAYVKGAAEELVPLTTLGPDARAEALAAAEALERQGLRVLALARRSLADGVPLDVRDVERELELLGLVGMLDPPRPEVPEAIERCRRAGIRIVMVTGDSGTTARAVADRIGLVDPGTTVVTGHELAGLDDAALDETLAEGHAIFARIAPEQKLRLVHALRRRGEIVAVTGDGVNDAPALREADIGVAMGREGTDVARETADMILLDDNFATIVAAVEEGRAIYANIRRFAAYHFCSNVGELVPFLVWGLSGGAIPLPLVVMQVLAIDLGTDMLPAIALGTERAEPGTMERPPRPRGERLLNRRVLARVYGFVGPLEGLAAMTSFFVGFLLGGWRPGQTLPSSGPVYVQATTMTATAIMTSQVGAGMAMRTDRRSVFSVGLLSNRFLLVGIAFELALAAALIWVPGLNAAFHQGPLSAPQVLFLLLWPPVVLGAEELRKWVVRRRGR
jgi:magnesium-transporting ATPase (P-type)